MQVAAVIIFIRMDKPFTGTQASPSEALSIIAVPPVKQLAVASGIRILEVYGKARFFNPVFSGIMKTGAQKDGYRIQQGVVAVYFYRLSLFPQVIFTRLPS